MLDLKYLKPREETDDCTLVVVSDEWWWYNREYFLEYGRNKRYITLFLDYIY